MERDLIKNKKMSPKKLFLALIILLFIFSFINYTLTKKLKDDKLDLSTPTKIVTYEPVLKKRKKPKKPVKIEYKLTPDNPDEFGFISHDSEIKMPRTVEGWEMHYKKVLKEKPIFEADGGQEALDLLQTKPKDYNNQMSLLDEHISMFEKKQSEDPLDEEVEGQLQRLYRLKALGNVLGDSVVTDNAPSIEERKIQLKPDTEEPQAIQP